MELWLAFIVIGALAGLFAGLLGIGGGGIMAPLLLLLFDLRGDPPAVAAVTALATSTAAILFTAVPSAIVHYLHGSINLRMLLWLSPVAICCAALAAQLALSTPPVLLVCGLSVFLSYGSWSILRRRNFADPTQPAAVSPTKLGVTGLFSGVIGTLTGTGGGIVVVPVLTHLQLPLIKAIGTSSGNTFFVALGGSLSYSGTGVDLVALLGMAPAIVVCAIVGARCANLMSRKALSIVYGTLLLVIIVGLLRWIVVELLP